MIPVPETTDLDAAFGNIKHMPKYDTVPEEFKDRNNKYVHYVSMWFFKGRNEEEIALLTPKEGVNKKNALNAIGSILASFEPKHEHKTAGAAYLLSEWFDLADEKKEAA